MFLIKKDCDVFITESIEAFKIFEYISHDNYSVKVAFFPERLGFYFAYMVDNSYTEPEYKC